LELYQLTERRDDWSAVSDPERPLRVALVVMPWMQTETPSIQCGLLKAGASQYGHEVDVHYLNLELAAVAGRELYRAIYGISTNGLPLKIFNCGGYWLW
jgi:hypothetical protein